MSVAAVSTFAAPLSAPPASATTLPSALATQPPALVASLPFAPAAIPLVGWATLVAWVYQDALARAVDHPGLSALGVAVFPPALVAYVRYRGERTAEQSDRERLTLAVLLAILAAMIVGTVFSPPDVFAQPRNTFGALLLTLPLFYVLVYRQPATDERSARDSESDEDGGGNDGPA